MLPLFRLEPYWEVSPGNTPYMDFTRRTKSKKGLGQEVFWTRQPQVSLSLLLVGVLGGLPEVGVEESLQGSACWNRAWGTTVEEEVGEKLGQFSAFFFPANLSCDVPVSHPTTKSEVRSAASRGRWSWEQPHKCYWEETEGSSGVEKMSFPSSLLVIYLTVQHNKICRDCAASSMTLPEPPLLATLPSGKKHSSL